MWKGKEGQGKGTGCHGEARCGYRERAEEGGQERAKGGSWPILGPSKWGSHPRMRGTPYHPSEAKELALDSGCGGWLGEGSAGVRMPGQLSSGTSVRHSCGQRSRSTDYVLKVALSSRKAAWRSLLFSSSRLRSSCSAFSSASNLLAQDKARTFKRNSRDRPTA